MNNHVVSEWRRQLRVLSPVKVLASGPLRYIPPYLWNVLPEGIRESDSVQSFKASLKTHFFNSHSDLLSRDVNVGSRCDNCVGGVCACALACLRAHVCRCLYVPLLNSRKVIFFSPWLSV